VEIAVLGLGAWGTAFANHLALKGHKVLGWTHSQEQAQIINSSKKNPAYCGEISLSDNLSATSDFTSLKEHKFFVVALPSSAIGEVSQNLLSLIDFSTKKVNIISLTKGFVNEEGESVATFLNRILGSSHTFFAVSGPSFAHDLLRKTPVLLTCAGKDNQEALNISQLVASENVRVYPSSDLLGVELCGALKNVLALACGVSDGLGLGDSARAALITRGVAELNRLVTGLGGESRTVYGLAGIGDLILTSSSYLSRNHRAGILLGKGNKVEAIIKELHSTIEGFRTSKIALKLANKNNIQAPIIEHLNHLISGGKSALDLVSALLSRPVKNE
jgi:glycerol-3-phosphate dehydrogenase (NAD(P)+)